MQGKLLEYSEQYKVPYGDVLELWEKAKKAAKVERLSPGEPQFYNFAIQKLDEILATTYATPVAPEEPAFNAEDTLRGDVVLDAEEDSEKADE